MIAALYVQTGGCYFGLDGVDPWDAPPPDLDWSRPAPTAQVSFCKNHGNSPLPRMSKRAAAATPPAFRAVLIGMARSAKIARAA